MRQVEIVLTREIEGAVGRHVGDTCEVLFRQWDGIAPLAFQAKEQWLFVDWILPTISGVEVCRRVKLAPESAHCYVTMVLDRIDADAARRSLQAGADDYMVGPLNHSRLLDRILVGDRSSYVEKYCFDAGELTIDPATHEARWDGRSLRLTSHELQVLHLLAHNPGRVFSRGDLVRELGKDPRHIDGRTVDVWITRVRKALRDAEASDLVRTVRQIGYALSDTA